MEKPKKIVKYKVVDYEAISTVQMFVELGKYLERLRSFDDKEIDSFKRLNQYFGIMLNLKLMADVIEKRLDVKFDQNKSIDEQLKNILKNEGIDPSLN